MAAGAQRLAMMRTDQSTGWRKLSPGTWYGVFGAVLVAIFLWREELNGAMLLLGSVLKALVLGFAFVLIIALRSRFSSSWKRWSYTIVAMLVLSAFVTWGDGIARRAKFAWLKRSYRATVMRIAAESRSQPIPVGFWPGTECFVDAGPPLRIAFLRPGGLLDNWCAYVYDPSDELNEISANGELVSADLPDRHRLRSIFGGDLVYCERLEARWYFCCFT